VAAASATQQPRPAHGCAPRDTPPPPRHPARPQDVVWRVGSSFLGPFKPDFMDVTMTSPDLYGPFWVATTLVFVTAVAGNYAEFIAWNRGAAGGGGGGSGSGGGNGTAPIPAPGGGGAAPGPGLAQLQWYTDYAKMSYSAMLFYGYVFVLGVALYFALRWFRWGGLGPGWRGLGGWHGVRAARRPRCV
jgi:hypothetical protein